MQICFAILYCRNNKTPKEIFLHPYFFELLKPIVAWWSPFKPFQCLFLFVVCFKSVHGSWFYQLPRTSMFPKPQWLTAVLVSSAQPLKSLTLCHLCFVFPFFPVWSISILFPGPSSSLCVMPHGFQGSSFSAEYPANSGAWEHRRHPCIIGRSSVRRRTSNA